MIERQHFSPETLKHVLTQVNKTNQNLFEEDSMQLEQDKQVMLVTTVKTRGLEGDVKVQLLLSSDEGQGSGLTKQGYYKKSKASCATRKPRDQS